MAKGRTRNSREDKKDRAAAGLKLSHKAKRQIKKALVTKQVEDARGGGKTPSAHAVLRAQGIPGRTYASLLLHNTTITPLMKITMIIFSYPSTSFCSSSHN